MMQDGRLVNGSHAIDGTTFRVVDIIVGDTLGSLAIIGASHIHGERVGVNAVLNDGLYRVGVIRGRGSGGGVDPAKPRGPGNVHGGGSPETEVHLVRSEFASLHAEKYD